MLYKLELDSLKTLVSTTSSSEGDLNELWHKKMGHLHYGALRMLKEIVKGVPELSTEHDDGRRGCVLGKYAKATFPRSDSKSEGVLQLVHSYIFCPMSTRAIRGYEYLVTFIDDYSRKT